MFRNLCLPYLLQKLNMAMANIGFTALFFIMISGIIAQQEETRKIVEKQPVKLNIQSETSQISDILEKVHKLTSLVTKQKQILLEQHKKLELQENRMRYHGETLQRQAQQLKDQVHKIADLQQGLKDEILVNKEQKQKIDQCVARSNKIDKIQTTNLLYNRPDHYGNNITLYQSTIYGCLYAVLNMSCNDGGLVFVISAEYGQYAAECTGECCAPDTVNDCTETLEMDDPEGWANLRFACNYESSCGFQHQAHGMTNCPVEKLADYLSVTYTCSDGSPLSNPVAFTAYTETTRSYFSGETLIFEYTVTNNGGYYNTGNSTFVCPFDGLYGFYVNIMADDSDYMIARIMLDDNLLVSAFADELTTSADFMDNHASNLAFTDCLAGQHVWVEAYDSVTYMSSSFHRLSTFSGYLVVPY